MFANGGSPDEAQVLENVFLISSEHGFTLSTGNVEKPLVPWKCTVPSAVGGLYTTF